MLQQPPIIQVARFNWEGYRADMNALIGLCHTLYHITLRSLQYAGAVRQRDKDYHKLLEDYNELLHRAQEGLYWKQEAARYLDIIAALDAELREREKCPDF